MTCRLSGKVCRSTPRSFYIRTYGCQMNQHDSEHVAGVLVSAGYKEAAGPDDADVVIYNTCSVRQKAEDRVFGNIASEYSCMSPRPLVAICGCIAERHRERILDTVPTVDLVFGLDALDRLPELIELSCSKRVVELGDITNAAIDHLPAVRRNRHAAWVPISQGCSNMCSYCVVPSARGPERSRSMGEILQEVNLLAENGVLEVTLLGQNVNSYGNDLGLSNGFSSLLRELASINGIARVKFESSHPKDLTEEVLAVMGEENNICPYLHMAVQSGSDEVLARMNRGYTGDYFLGLLEQARRIVPRIRLSSDFIVGFPGETEEDFSDTLAVAEAAALDSAFMFIYSPREGTAAHEMNDSVPYETKKERFQRLSTLQNRITRRSLASQVGETVEVLVEGCARDGVHAAGRTRGHVPIIIPQERLPGQPLFMATVTGSGGHSLRGLPLE